MHDVFLRYLYLLLNDIPLHVYESLVAVFCIASVVLLALKGFKGGWRYVSGMLLAEYVLLLYCSTVIFRHDLSDRDYDFIPFWSYFAYLSGSDSQLLSENIMNVVVFLPVGLLLGFSFHYMSWFRALLIGLSLSVGIESLQFIFMRGFTEFDDVMHNTLGCVIGYGFFRLLYSLVNLLKCEICSI